MFNFWLHGKSNFFVDTDISWKLKFNGSENKYYADKMLESLNLAYFDDSVWSVHHFHLFNISTCKRTKTIKRWKRTKNRMKLLQLLTLYSVILTLQNNKYLEHFSIDNNSQLYVSVSASLYSWQSFKFLICFRTNCKCFNRAKMKSNVVVLMQFRANDCHPPASCKATLTRVINELTAASGMSMLKPF